MDRFLDTRKVNKFEKLVKESTSIVLTCHVRPDGDAIGSTLGWKHLLGSLGKSVTVVVPDSAPRSLSFLPGFDSLAIYTRHEEYCAKLFNEADLIICCDFNQPSRLDKMEHLLEDSSCAKVMIDHHVEPSPYADVQFSFPDMSSTCELSFRIMAELGLYSEMNLDCATCLLTGIITDTKNFTVNCKNPDLYEILQHLLEKGCDKNRIVRLALLEKSYGALRLEAYALSEKMEIFPEYHASVICLSKEECERYHYEKGDTEGLVNKPTEIKGITYSFFLREDSDCVKVSARSVMEFPVNLMCKELYGGGGHVMAAGAEYEGTLEECRKMLVDSFPKYSHYLKGRTERLDYFSIE
ncbi:MAG: bifunctional oligoribonuclease/PAP phosphatase NrnA [Muribaculaceae bacterium]|nr:bifunctional oligoribonuclease/PAP phosphatase NrnA [Muribaculaceae bacterium]